jgi:hypothetical protein
MPRDGPEEAQLLGRVAEGEARHGAQPRLTAHVQADWPAGARHGVRRELVRG